MATQTKLDLTARLNELQNQLSDIRKQLTAEAWIVQKAIAAAKRDDELERLGKLLGSVLRGNEAANEAWDGVMNAKVESYVVGLA